MNQVFGQMGSMSVFLEERLIFGRERASGFYSTLPYFIAKTVTEVSFHEALSFRLRLAVPGDVAGEKKRK